ncbi:ABC transporter permease [Arthrobacter sp. AQ5-06]|nr:ABC transporter permease [Arthrobacter sp. AQ5-06]
MIRSARGALLQLWLPILLIGLWWITSTGSTSLYFPALSDILDAVGQLWLFEHAVSDLLPSMRNMLTGFLLAVVIGVIAGLILGSLPRLLDAVEPELELARALPAVAILPIAILVLGLGDNMRVFVITLGAVWPVLLNTTAAVRGIDPTVRDVESAFGIDTVSRYLRVRLPAALPQILAGARVSLYISIALLVISEMQGAGQGIGHFILASQRNYAVVDMWSGVIVLGVIGYLLQLAFRAGEAALLRNYPPQRTGK